MPRHLTTAHDTKGRSCMCVKDATTVSLHSKCINITISGKCKRATHCVSELNDISGASSSKPVNVLTHTISDVSHRLTTASEALDARYLDVKNGAKVVIKCSGCCQDSPFSLPMLHYLRSGSMPAAIDACSHIGNPTLEGAQEESKVECWWQTAQQRCTCRWGPGAGGRRAQTDHDQ